MKNDKDILIDYFEKAIKYAGSETHKIYLYRDKIEHIDYWVNTKWGKDKIKEIKKIK
jgi:hypothetical protein